MKRVLCCMLVLLSGVVSVCAYEKRPLEVDDIFRFGRVMDPFLRGFPGSLFYMVRHTPGSRGTGRKGSLFRRLFQR